MEGLQEIMSPLRRFPNLKGKIGLQIKMERILQEKLHRYLPILVKFGFKNSERCLTACRTLSHLEGGTLMTADHQCSGLSQSASSLKTINRPLISGSGQNGFFYANEFFGVWSSKKMDVFMFIAANILSNVKIMENSEGICEWQVLLVMYL